MSAIHVQDGFASRNCFCLWSTGYQGHEIKRAIEDNHKTYLHTLWQEDHLYIAVSDEESGRGTLHFSCCRLLWSLASYPLGMIGYLVDTLVKVVLVVGNLLVFLIALISCDTKWRDCRGVILVDTLAAAGISIIGIVAPPLAYKLDQMAKQSLLEWAVTITPFN